MRITKKCGGMDRLFVFNMIAVEMFNVEYQAIVNKKLNDSTVEVTGLAAYAILYAGLCGAAIEQGVAEPAKTEAHVWASDMYENGQEKDIDDICNVWMQTRAYAVWAQRVSENLKNAFRTVKDTADKKKVKKKRSTNGSASTSSSRRN